MHGPTSAGVSGSAVYAANPGTVQYVAVGDTVLPGDAEDTLDTPRVEGVEAAFLAHVCGPRFAAIEEGAQHTGLVDSHLGVLSEHLIFPYSFGQLGHSDCGFSDVPVYLSVQRKVVGDV